MNGTYTDTVNNTSSSSYATHSSGTHTWATNWARWTGTTNRYTPYTLTRTFYLDCGNINQAINGHYSATPSYGWSRERVTHSSTHTNY
jgi:hypothetical protein